MVKEKIIFFLRFLLFAFRKIGLSVFLTLIAFVITENISFSIFVFGILTFFGMVLDNM